MSIMYDELQNNQDLISEISASNSQHTESALIVQPIPPSVVATDFSTATTQHTDTITTLAQACTATTLN